jgi:hypothetical protein
LSFVSIHFAFFYSLSLNILVLRNLIDCGWEGGSVCLGVIWRPKDVTDVLRREPWRRRRAQLAVADFTRRRLTSLSILFTAAATRNKTGSRADGVTNGPTWPPAVRSKQPENGNTDFKWEWQRKISRKTIEKYRFFLNRTILTTSWHNSINTAGAYHKYSRKEFIN